jgi:predicted transcriptional regulator
MITNNLELSYAKESVLKQNMEGPASLLILQEKRASYDILAGLLHVLSTEPEINQTRLAQRSHLDTRMTAKYLKLLLDNLLVNKEYRRINNRPIVQITQKGRGFLEQYMILTSMLN